MVTRNGVYYDLALSPYKFKTPDTKLTYVFSSDLHMLKFEDNYLKYRDEQNIKFKARFRVNTSLSVLHDIVLYKRIESRGFLIINEGGNKICQENLILIGEKVTAKS